jgi:hypothetical protein
MSAPQYPIPGSPNSTTGEYNNPSPNSQSGANNLIGNAPGSITGITPASTSGVSGWIPDILTIIQEAAEHASVDATTGYLLRSAKRSLDVLAMSWSNAGLNQWLLDEQYQVLSPGLANYVLPADTVDVVAPAISTTSNGQTIQITIARQDFSSYLSIPNKAFTGKPNTIFVNRISPPQFFCWPVPDTYQVYTLAYWRLRRMCNTGYATNSLDAPDRMIPAMIYGLAWQLALKKKAKDYNLIQLLKSNYDQELEKALDSDRDRSSIYLAPFIAYD